MFCLLRNSLGLVKGVFQLADYHAPFSARAIRELLADSFCNEKVNEEFAEPFWSGVRLERAD